MVWLTCLEVLYNGLRVHVDRDDVAVLGGHGDLHRVVRGAAARWCCSTVRRRAAASMGRELREEETCRRVKNCRSDHAFAR
jgi:hypothetical protein